jgi:hypothetical protein
MTETRKRGSAGLPSMDGDDRIAELEGRLARLEGTPSLRERGRSLMSRVMPDEASQHFRNAGREQLLGIRSIIDFWLRRIDELESRSADEGREKIQVD